MEAYYWDGKIDYLSSAMRLIYNDDYMHENQFWNGYEVIYYRER